MKETVEWVNNYSFRDNGHQFRAMAGYSYQYFQKSNMSAENGDFDSNALTYNALGAGTWASEEGNNGMGSFKEDSKLIAFFGRLHYDWQGRYIVTASLRYEGSSRFGANNKWGYFPAFSVGWRISEEPFMKNAGWIDELKLRADYGETGNQNFANYLSLSTFSPDESWYSYIYKGKNIYTWGNGAFDTGKNPNPNQIRILNGKRQETGI